MCGPWFQLIRSQEKWMVEMENPMTKSGWVKVVGAHGHLHRTVKNRSQDCKHTVSFTSIQQGIYINQLALQHNWHRAFSSNTDCASAVPGLVYPCVRMCEVDYTIILTANVYRFVGRTGVAWSSSILAWDNLGPPVVFVGLKQLKLGQCKRKQNLLCMGYMMIHNNYAVKYQK